MKIEYIVGKTVTLIITPENEIDKAALIAISKGELTSTVISQSTHLLDKSVTEGIIIKTKTKEA